MKSKLYYTNGIKAGWMAEQFGVKYHNGKHEIFVTPFIDCEAIHARYIHSDSLPLFEPKDGDIVKSDAWVGVYFKNTRFIQGKPPIIQRDNKAFFTPEVEHAAQ